MKLTIKRFFIREVPAKEAVSIIQIDGEYVKAPTGFVFMIDPGLVLPGTYPVRLVHSPKFSDMQEYMHKMLWIDEDLKTDEYQNADNHALLHIGNSILDSSRCFLIGTHPTIGESGFSDTDPCLSGIYNSRDTYRFIYPILATAAEANNLICEIVNL